MNQLKIKQIFQNFPYKMSGQICKEKMEKQPPRKWTFFKNEERFFQTATGVLKMKVQSTSINMLQKVQLSATSQTSVSDFLIQKWLKSCFPTIHRQFFQSENTKCGIFQLNRLIRCQTQERSQKMCWFGKFCHFVGGENHDF
jgi:hypothetical protein